MHVEIAEMAALAATASVALAAQKALAVRNLATTACQWIAAAPSTAALAAIGSVPIARGVMLHLL